MSKLTHFLVAFTALALVFTAASFTYPSARGAEFHNSFAPVIAATSTPTPNGPTLYISYREGAPQSVFTFTGLSFPADESVSIQANGHLIATLDAVPGSSNWFIFHLDSTDANEGLYLILAQTQSVARQESFILSVNEPVREQIRGPVFDDAPVFLLPTGIAFTSQSLLPTIMKP